MAPKGTWRVMSSYINEVRRCEMSNKDITTSYKNKTKPGAKAVEKNIITNEGGNS